jgi:hypothetical protein
MPARSRSQPRSPKPRRCPDARGQTRPRAGTQAQTAPNTSPLSNATGTSASSSRFARLCTGRTISAVRIRSFSNNVTLRQLGRIAIHLACCKKSTLQAFQHAAQRPQEIASRERASRIFLPGHRIVKTGAAARRAQIAKTRGVSQFPGDRCKRLELFAHGVRWKEEQEYKIDGPAIDCFKINRPVEARQNAE